MNRKLHNTFLGLTASTAMLSLALALGAPAQPVQAEDALATAIEHEVRAALADAGLAVDEAEHAAVAATAARAAAAAILGAPGREGAGDGDGGPRRGRHALVVPYFSFAPRG